MQKKTTKLRFSEADLADAKVRKAAEKAEKAVKKADAAKARLPGKKLRTKTTMAQAQGEKLRFGKKEIVTEETVKKPTAIGKKAAAKGAAASVSGTVHKQAAEYQDDRSDGLGAAYEQPESAGGGDRDGGAYHQLSFTDFFPTEQQQIEAIDRMEITAESEK